MPEVKVGIFIAETKRWDDYVLQKLEATFFHQLNYKKVIEETFGHKAYYLFAESNNRICGVLPLFTVKSRIFGNILISLPFCDYAGILADDDETRRALFEKAIEIGKKEAVDIIELRQKHDSGLALKQHLGKVNLLLPVTSEEAMWNDLTSQGRKKIRKAWKSGFHYSWGGAREMSWFYKVYSTNMHDLGTPANPKKYFYNLLKYFPGSEVFIVLLNGRPVSGAIVSYFRDTLEVHKAHSLKKHSHYYLNNMLYWEIIRRACEKNMHFCSFGRSSVGTGIYDFKKQWGMVDEQLYYEYCLIKGKKYPDLHSTNPKYKLFSSFWRKLPLALADRLSSFIIKNIP